MIFDPNKEYGRVVLVDKEPETLDEDIKAMLDFDMHRQVPAEYRHSVEYRAAVNNGGVWGICWCYPPKTSRDDLIPDAKTMQFAGYKRLHPTRTVL